MYYCPKCSAELPGSDISGCPKCGAIFGVGGGWKPLSAPPTDEERSEPSKFAEALLAAILLVCGFGFLCLSLALRGTALGPSAPFAVGSVLLVFGFLAARSTSKESSKIALIGGLVCLAAVVAAFALLVSAFPP